MKMSRGAIGNLVSRYRAVLKKCRLLNLLGTLALAGSCILSTSQVATAVEYSEDTTIVIENWPNDNGNIINTSDQNTGMANKIVHKPFYILAFQIADNVLY